jgi:predicted component of type VI protein secretion system
MCLGYGDASEYEVLIDMELADQGEKKVVGIDILDMDSFDPEKVVGVPTEYIPLIKEVFTEYKRGV